MNILQTVTDTEKLPIDPGTQRNNRKFSFTMLNSNTNQSGNTTKVSRKAKNLN